MPTRRCQFEFFAFALDIHLDYFRQPFLDDINDFKGLNQRSPWLAFIMLLLMLSLAGIPPTVGFYAKFSVLSAAVNARHIQLAVLFSLVGAFYYLRLIKLMYFDTPESPTPRYPSSPTAAC